MAFSNRARSSLSSIFLPSNLIVFISAIIVMGILSYWFSAQHYQPAYNTYILVTSVLTVAFFLASFFLEDHFGYHLLFNLIFSWLWIVVVAFTANQFSYASRQAQTVEAFSFLAFFALAFNVLYSWYTGVLGAGAVATTEAPAAAPATAEVPATAPTV